MWRAVAFVLRRSRKVRADKNNLKLQFDPHFSRQNHLGGRARVRAVKVGLEFGVQHNHQNFLDFNSQYLERENTNFEYSVYLIALHSPVSNVL